MKPFGASSNKKQLTYKYCTACYTHLDKAQRAKI